MTTDALDAVDAWWRAANYLAAGQLYLWDNPLLAETVAPAHLKPRPLGHWGTVPGITLVWAHLARAIRERDLDALLVCGPGHGAAGVLASCWLEGSYGERFPDVGWDEDGMRRLFRQFSFPGGVPSHAGPETPGSIHEGGELGYALLHAHGAAFDAPGRTVVCVVGDGEAETGALAASWQSARFVDPVRDGAVLPVLHLNGYKIDNPTVFGRMEDDALASYFRGLGYAPAFVEGREPARIHPAFAAALDAALDAHGAIRAAARDGEAPPPWPLIVLRTPKGWTGPGTVAGKTVEGTHRAHQLPLKGIEDAAERAAALDRWMRSYRPEALFEDGRPVAAIRALAPEGPRRMGANPATVPEVRPLGLPDVAVHLVEVAAPGSDDASAARAMGGYLRDVIHLNPETFRLFGPDEVESNRLGPVFEATERTAPAGTDALAPRGRVIEVLSEHLCQGWLEGYTLTGRHGLFTSYEAFAPIVASMLNQHMKWLRTAPRLAWREAPPSLNLLLTSHCWRQDHNGFSHQDPGLLDHVAAKPPDVARIYLPPDANTALHVLDLCLRSRGRANVIVAGKQAEPRWLDGPAAARHVEAGFGVWDWAGHHGEPDVVIACAGDVPTIEALAATAILRERMPDLRLRVVNVVDLLRLQAPETSPHGASQAAFAGAFTTDRPVVFAFHGYAGLVHRLWHGRPGPARLHVHGYREMGTTTTPFDMCVLNGIDRYALAKAVAGAAGGRPGARALAAWCDARHRRHAEHIRREGVDLPEIRGWRWPG